MNKFKRKLYCLPVAIGLSLSSGMVSSNSLISAPDAIVEAQVSMSQDPTVIREKAVFVSADLIKPSVEVSGLVAADAVPASSLSLELDFFDEPEPMVLALDQAGSMGKDNASWVGHVEDDPDSEVILVAGDQGIVQGNITTNGKKYHLRYVEHIDGQAVHTLQEIDMSKFPPDHPVGHESGVVELPEDLNVSNASPSGNSDAQSDTPIVAEPDTEVVGSGAIIDAMVLYTADAATEVGGSAAMDTLIALAITETNTGYENSGIAQRMNLIHSQQVVYTETGGSMLNTLMDLRNINSPPNYVAPNPITVVPGLRDTHNADLVGLLVSDAYSGCGLGWVGPSYDAGYQVTRQDCATGTYSFAHEFGHNQGARHDRVTNQNSSNPYGFSGDGNHYYGYRNLAKSWRTIMAYNDTTNCAELPTPPYAPGQNSCIRQNFWSNPDKSYNGDPTGVVSTDPDAADNRKLFNDNAYTVTNFEFNHSTYVLSANQWHQIGLPYAPPAGQSTVADILGDDMTGTIDVDWALYRFDAATGVYVALALTDTMQQGVGYWIINVPGQVTLDMPTGFSETPTPVTGAKCPSSSGCFETPALATVSDTHQWNMLGNPYPQNKQLKGIVVDSTHSACQATNGCSFDNAVTSAQVNGQAYHYNPVTGSYDEIGSDDYLSPWAGFWFATLQGADGTSPKLLIPSNVQR